MEFLSDPFMTFCIGVALGIIFGGQIAKYYRPKVVTKDKPDKVEKEL